ncbi:hypothetical protein [Burkholderia gladioli]|uniref:hypothetical protein n=1 Tax=Burkholderia gladioli TaxID=28095 RepID=UPI0015E7912B|nr:hypothetical protein [Burkholderia gladioli]MBA1366940.1 hypothetical protein [Burkholderia gladioli]
MSKKHEQRTRSEILAKREQPIMGFRGRPAPISRPANRSKYMPHFGKKQTAKIDGSYYAR